MAELNFTSVNDVVLTLKSKYSALSDDISYYKKIVSRLSDLSFAEMFDEAERIILTDPRLNIAALLICFEKGLVKKDNYLYSLDELARKCAQWQIDIDIDTLQTLIDKSALIASALNSISESMGEKTINSIEKLNVSKSCRELLINYFLLKGYIDVNDLIAKDSNLENESIDIYSNNSLDIYMKEIKKIPPLSFEEQILLGKRIQMGDKEAKRKLIEHNLLLVVHFAKKFAGHGIEFGDLIQAGNEGLIKAAQRYKPEKGYKFSTYAFYWIYRDINNLVLNGTRFIQLPLHASETVAKIYTTKNRLTVLMGREPSLEEIAEDMMISPEILKNYINIPDAKISLDSKLYDEDGNEVQDIVPDENMPTPEEQAINSALVDSINAALSLLTPKQEMVIRLRFAIQDNKHPQKEFERVHTLEEVAMMFNVTREMIRQTEKKALLRLRQPTIFKHIESYYASSSTSRPSAAKVQEDVRSKNYINDDYTIDASDRSAINTTENMDNSKQVEKKLSKFLWERLGCTNSEYEIIKKYILRSKAKKFNILFFVHGDNLDQEAPVSILTPEQKTDYYDGIHDIRIKLQKIRKVGMQKLQTVLGMNDDDFALATQFLKKFDDEKIIESIFGTDYQEYGNIATLNPTKVRTFNSLVKQAKEYVDTQRKTITLPKMLSCPDEIWPDIREYILQKEEFSKIFIPIFGPDLLSEAQISFVNTFKGKDLTRVIRSIQKVIYGYVKYVGKNIATIALLDEDEEDVIYSLLCDNSELTTLFGADLTSPLRASDYFQRGREDITRLFKIVFETKHKFRRLRRLQQYSAESDNISINGVNILEYNKELLKQAVKLVPLRYRGILILHLGLLGDGIFYPLEKLVIIFNKDKASIESDILRGKAYLEEILLAYQKACENGLNESAEEFTRKRVEQD